MMMLQFHIWSLNLIWSLLWFVKGGEVVGLPLRHYFSWNNLNFQSFWDLCICWRHSHRHLWLQDHELPPSILLWDIPWSHVVMTQFPIPSTSSLHCEILLFFIFHLYWKSASQHSVSWVGSLVSELCAPPAPLWSNHVQCFITSSPPSIATTRPSPALLPSVQQLFSPSWL